MRTRIVLSPCALALAAAAVAAVLSLAFAHWTASTGWAFPLFLAVLPFFIYFPGKLLLDTSGARLLPLEHLSLSLTLGLLASSLVHALTTFLGVPVLFLCWPAAATLVCLYRARRSGWCWRSLGDSRLELDRAHLLLAVVLSVACGLLAVMPGCYRNLKRLPDGGLRFFNSLPDWTLHLTIANELSHTVPPQHPTTTGWPLAYHFAADLPAALFHAHAGLDILDLTVRFIPTLFLLMTALSVFTFARSWLGSGSAAAVTTLLVLLGEDFAFVPGLLLHSRSCWSAQYFGVPTTFSLYLCNPMLPAVGLFFAGLFCLHKQLTEGGRGWLFLTVLHLGVVLEYKVFLGLHGLLALGLAAVICWLRWRDGRLLRVAVPLGLLVAVLMLPMWWCNRFGAGQMILLRVNQLLPQMVCNLGLAETHWGRHVLKMVGGGGPVTLKGVAACLFLALPVYLLGSLGMRVLALPGLCRSLVRPSPESAARTFLALFVVLGPLLTLGCYVVHRNAPLEQQYNNSVWFYVQAKYVAWVFAVEALWALARKLRPAVRLVPVSLVLALAVPATVQFFWGFRNMASDVFGREEAEVTAFLASHASPGQTVLPRAEHGLPLPALTCCRVPISSLPLFGDSFVPAQETARRLADRDAFWGQWAKGELRADVLRRYRVDYLVIDRAIEPGTGPASSPSNGLQLRRCFENHRFVVYSIVPGAR